MEEIVISRREHKFPLDGVVYRSGFEKRQAERLKKNNINFEYETIQFPWKEPINNAECDQCGNKDIKKDRLYTPDFWFPKSQIFVETKGRFTAQNRTFMSHIVKYAPYEVRMVFMNDNWLSKKKSMSYSRWCELNGINCAIGAIPLEWVENDRIN